MRTPEQNDIDLFIVWFLDKYPEISEDILARLLLYGELLREGSDRKGLVARGDRPHLLQRHFCEVLAPPLVERLEPGAHVLDVGSGGGLPGIPLAVVRPDIHLTLIEPRHRKVKFLERAVLALGVANRSIVLPGSLEELVRNRRRARYDVALSRGLRWTPAMTKSLEQLLIPAGVLIRFGSPGFSLPGVESIPLEGSRRAIQVWPRPVWGQLPNAG